MRSRYSFLGLDEDRRTFRQWSKILSAWSKPVPARHSAPRASVLAETLFLGLMLTLPCIWLWTVLLAHPLRSWNTPSYTWSGRICLRCHHLHIYALHLRYQLYSQVFIIYFQHQSKLVFSPARLLVKSNTKTWNDCRQLEVIPFWGFGLFMIYQKLISKVFIY